MLGNVNSGEGCMLETEGTQLSAQFFREPTTALKKVHLRKAKKKKPPDSGKLLPI